LPAFVAPLRAGKLGNKGRIAGGSSHSDTPRGRLARGGRLLRGAASAASASPATHRGLHPELRLPDGTTAWWMSDTMTGTANPNNSVSNGGFRHNTLVRQNNTCLTPKFGSPDMINGTGGA
jgi:hypothetical protein